MTSTQPTGTADTSLASVPGRVVVVVPTYNERETLPVLTDLLASLALPDLHIVVVDDDSPDGTGAVADEIAAREDGTVHVLHRAQKAGLGRAYVAGITRALADGADVVIQMDADLSHPVTAIPAMLDALRKGDAGLVIGSRYVPGGSVADDWPATRRLLSRFANSYVNAILGLGIHDATAGFKAWRADVLRAIDLESVTSSGYSFQVEMNERAARLGCHVVEVPIRFAERTSGVSKMSLAVQLESARTPWRLRWQRRRR